MTKLAIVITGALFSGAFVAGAARAADKAPAAAAPAAAAPAAAKAPAAAGPAAAAPAAAPPAAPTPSPEVDALSKGWVGSYKCDTTFAAGAMGPGSPELKAKSEVKIAKDLGGFWYKGDYKMKKSKTMPMAMEAVFLLGYDAIAKAPINLNYDSMGTFAMEHGAAGATADKISFVGDGQMMGMKIKIREGMTKKDDKTVEHTFEVDMGKGFQAMGTDICKK